MSQASSLRAAFARLNLLETRISLLADFLGLAMSDIDKPRVRACGPESPSPSSPKGAASSDPATAGPQGDDRKRLTGRFGLAGVCSSVVKASGTETGTEDHRRACGTEEPKPDSPAGKERPGVAAPGPGYRYPLEDLRSEEL
jgi:hypothetical protein